MYPTFSNNINRDNASVYSGNSTHTCNSIAYRNGTTNTNRMIPRSNSTSDLFDIPLYNNGNNRKKKLPIKQSPARRQPLRASHSTTSLTTNGSGRVPAHVQRSHPQPNIQQKYDHHLNKRYHRMETQQHTQQQRLSNYEYQPQHSFTYNKHSGNTLNPIPERYQARHPANQLLTPYQLQRRQMKNSFQFPNGENFTPKNRLGVTLPRSNSAISLNNSNGSPLYALSRSQSMNSLPLKVDRLPNAMIVASSSSPVTSASSTSSNNSMREHSSSDSTNLSSGPSTHSSNTALVVGAISQGEIAKKKPSVSISKHSHNPIRVNKDDMKVKTAQSTFQEKSKSKKSKLGTFFRKLFSSSSSSSLSSSSSSIIAPSAPSSLQASTKNREKRTKHEPVTSIPSITTIPMAKKLPKEKQIAKTLSSTRSNSITEDDFSVGRKENAFSDNDDNDDEDDDEDDDILMDTDLVFDSLLLKANSNRQSLLQKQHDLQEKLQKLTSSHTSYDILADQKKKLNVNPEEESTIDYDLIAEFSKLGEYIDETPITPATSSPHLPPRSARRPTLTNKDSARLFYHPSNAGRDSSEELLRRLYRDWKTVHIDSTHSPSAESKVLDPDLKALRFSGDIYVNDTWSPLEYQRSDKRFIKNRRRMMQLENEGFIQEIKVELNEFKRCDMIVHEESVQFTHYFL